MKTNSHDGLAGVQTARALAVLRILDPVLPVDLHHVGAKRVQRWQPTRSQA